MKRSFSFLIQSLVSIVISLLAISAINSSAVQCHPPETAACKDGTHCCYSGFYDSYTCCPKYLSCCGDGLYCCGDNPLINSLRKRPIKIPAILPNSPQVEDYLVIVHSFLDNIGFYEYFPKTSLTTDDILALYPLVMKYIEEIKEAESVFEYIEIALEALDDFEPVIKKIVADSEGVPEEVKEKINAILAVLKSEGYTQKLIANIKARYSEVIINVSAARTMCTEGYYKQCGRNAAIAIAIIFMID